MLSMIRRVYYPIGAIPSKLRFVLWSRDKIGMRLESRTGSIREPEYSYTFAFIETVMPLLTVRRTSLFSDETPAPASEAAFSASSRPTGASITEWLEGD